MRVWVGVILTILLFSHFAFSQNSDEPSLQEVCEQALKYAHLETKTIQGWEKNVRKAPFLPRFQIGFDRRVRSGVDINLEDSVAVNSSGVTVGPTQQRQVQNADSDLNFEVKAVWYLDQLLFSRDHLDISKEARYLNAERDRIFSQVRKYYFQRKRGLKTLALLKSKRASLLEREIKTLDVAETVSALDNLTGGWFSLRIQSGK